MKRTFLKGALLAMLAACTNLLGGVTEVHVGKDFIKVAGTTVQAPEELFKFLTAQKVKRVRLRIDPGVDNYENVGKVIYTVYRAGAEIEPVDMPKQ